MSGRVLPSDRGQDMVVLDGFLRASGRVAWIVAWLLACALALVGPKVVAAVDQTNLNSPGGGFTFFTADRRYGQTFTVGFDGTLEAVTVDIRLQGDPADGVVAEIQGVSGGLPDGNVLASTSIPVGSLVSGLNRFDFSAAGLDVSAGSQLALVLSSPGSAAGFAFYQAQNSAGDTYAGGAAVFQLSAIDPWVQVASGGTDAVFETEVASPLTVSGVVTLESSGGALGDVTVCAIRFFDNLFAGCGTSDANGAYVITDLPPGTYEISIDTGSIAGSGLVPETYDDLPELDGLNLTTPVVVGPDSPTGINFALEPGGVISGQVTDSATGAVLSNWNVCVYLPDRSFLNCVQTNGAGSYAFAPLPPGSYIVQTSSPDPYLDEFYPNITSINPQDAFALATPIFVGPDDATGINFELDQGASVRGTVSDAVTTNAIAGATVCITFSSGRGATCATSDVNGAYQTRALPPGEYVADVLTGRVPGYVGEYYLDVPQFGGPSDPFAAATRFDVLADDVDNINFTLDAGFPISGEVTDSVSGAPLADATVCVTRSDSSFGFCSQTDASGNYTSDALPDGDYVVEVSGYNVPGYIGEYYLDVPQFQFGDGFAQATRVTVAGAERSGIDLALDPGTTFRGTVTEEATGNPVTSGNVCVYRVGDQRRLACAGIAGDGTYEIPAQPAGDYYLEASSFPLVEEFYLDVPSVANSDPFSDALVITIDPTDLPTSVTFDFALASGLSISGTVVDEGSGAPVPDLRLCLYTSTAFARCATTDSNGVYVADGLVPGQYRVEVDTYDLGVGNLIPEAYDNRPLIDAGGVADLVTLVDVDVDGIDFALARGNTISGRLTNEAGDAAPFGSVCFEDVATSGRICTGVDANGDYVSPGLAAGSYRVDAFPNDPALIPEYYDDVIRDLPGARTLATPVSVGPNDATGINFVLSTGFTLSGAVVEEGTLAPVVGLTVCVILESGGGDCPVTDANGVYSAAGLTPGGYIVQVDQSDPELGGLIPEYYDDVSIFSTFDPFSDATRVAISDSDVNGIDFALARGNTISGRVADEVGAPVPFGSVCFQDVDTFSQVCASVDINGDYVSPGLPTGSYLVQVFPGDSRFIDQYYDGIFREDPNSRNLATPVAVGPGDATGIDFTLVEGNTISGTVVVAGTGVPVADTFVCAFRDIGGGDCGRTDANGAYVIAGLLPGDYVVEIDAFNLDGLIPEYYDGVSRFTANAFQVAARVPIVDSDVVNIDFALTPGSTISGTVTNEDTGLAVPFSTVCVELFAQAGSQSACSSTDDLGRYTTAGLPPGTYRLFVFPNDPLLIAEYYDGVQFQSTSDPASLATPVAVGTGDVNGINFTLNGGRTISGTVTTGPGDPVPGARICFENIDTGAGGGCVIADVDGGYTSSALVGGSYRVLMDEALGFAREYYDDILVVGNANAAAIATPVALGGTDVSGVNFVLEPGFTISGNVLDEVSVAPVPDSFVCVYVDDRTFVDCPSVEADGSFVTQFLPPGQYVLEASAGDGYFSEYYEDVPLFGGDRFDDATRIAISGADVSGIEIRIGQGAQIGGAVTAADSGEPLPGIEVCLYAQATQLQTGCQLTDVAGSYLFTNLPSDGYLAAVFRADGFIGQYYNGLSVFETGLSDATAINLGGADVLDVNFALQRATVIELLWEARVTEVSAPFLNANPGDLITGRLVYDSTATGTPAATGTDYLGAVLSSEADLNGITVLAALDGGAAINVDDQFLADGDRLLFSSIGSNGEFAGAPAATSLDLDFVSTGSAFVGETLTIRAPSLGAFDATAAVSLSVNTGSDSGGLQAELLSLQARPFVVIDRDGDGIPNYVETELGLNPDDPADAETDLDGDLIGTLTELRGSSDPENIASVPAAGFLRFTAGNTLVDEGDAVIPIEVERFAGNLGAVSVRVTTEDIDALDETHYDAVNTVLQWADGERGRKRVEIPVLDITPGIDVTRSVRVRMSEPDGIEIANSKAIAQIINNTLDPRNLDTVDFAGFIDTSQFDVRASEDSGEIELILNRRGSADGRVAVDYRLEVFGSSGNQLPLPQNLTGSIVWENLDAGLKVVRIPLYDNIAIAPDIDFRLVLENASGNAYNGVGLGVNTVEDEEALLRQSDTVGFSVRGARVVETEGAVSVELLRTGTDSSQPLSAQFFLAFESATAGVDYDAGAFSQTVDWGANDTAVKSLTFDVFDDGEAEEIELIVPFVQANTSNREAISIIRLFDDAADVDRTADADGDGIPDFADIDDDNDGTPNSVDAFPLDPTESSDTDFDGIGDSVDSDLDGDGVGDNIEGLLGLDSTNPDDAALADFDGDGFPDDREVRVGSDPRSPDSVPGPGFIELSLLNNVVRENAGGVSLRLRRVRGDVGSLDVTVSTEDASAVAGIDYSFAQQSFFFGDGDTFERDFFIPIFDNGDFDVTRSFRVRVTAQPGTDPDRVMADETLVYIVNDDVDAQGAPFAGQVTPRYNNLRVPESGGVAEIWLERIGSTEGELTVSYDFDPADATPDGDFVARAGAVSWGDGDGEPKRVLIPIIDDLDAETTEAFDVLFSVSSGAGEMLVDNTYVQIVDDELAYLDDAITSSQLEPNFEETGGTGTFSFFRLGDGAGDASVAVTFTDIEATNGPAGGVVYLWEGPCDSDCVGTATAVITLSSAYVPGTVVGQFDADLFVSLEYTSSNGSFVITRDTLISSGVAFTIDPTLTFDSYVYNGSDLWATDVQFGQWYADIAGVREIGRTSTGTFALQPSTPAGDFEVDTPQTLTWLAGETGRRTIDIALNDDAEFEDFEGFEVSLTLISGGAFLDDQLLDPRIADVEDLAAFAADDADLDGIPDLSDLDDDNDGRVDFLDEFPNDPTRVGDSDGDGVDDLVDAFPNDPGLSDDSVIDVGFIEKLRASDGEAGDAFGFSTDVDGATAVIGAAGDDYAGLNNPGSAYVFERNDAGTACPVTGSGDSWCEAFKLLPSAPEEEGRFGYVTIEDERIVVTSPNFLSQGAAYVFERNSESEQCAVTGSIDPWCETARLTGLLSVPGDSFGGRPAGLSGNTIAIGAENDSTVAASAGAVYLYERNLASVPCAATATPDAWCESRVYASDAAADDRFGHSVSLDGDTLIVAADRDDDNGENSGSVYVFRRNVANEVCPTTGVADAWCERAKLLPNDGATFDRFGRKIALKGNTAIIGAPLVGNGGGDFSTGRGAAYVFVNTGGDNWVQQDRVEAREGSGPGDIFGYPDFDGVTAVIGSPTDDDGGLSAGSAYVFIDAGGGDWQQQAKLRAPDAAEGDFFGDENAAVSGRSILVGAPNDDDLGGDSGSVYVFLTSDVDTDGDLIPDALDFDDDGDGLSDRTENVYPFMSRANPADADLDEDGDGVSNKRELLTGWRPDSADSVPDAGYVTLQSTILSFEHGDPSVPVSVSVPVQVRRVKGDAGSVTVRVETFDGPDLPGDDSPTVRAGVDYVETIQELTWNEGETFVQTVDVPLINSAERRSGVFGVRLVPVGDTRTLVNEGRILIQERDVEFSGIDYAGLFGNGSFSSLVPDSAGAVTVYVQRFGSDEGIASVDYEFLPGASGPVAGEDYVPNAGTLVWADGDRAPKEVTLEVIDSAFARASREVILSLRNPSANARVSEFSQSIVIVDDEFVQLNSVSAATLLSAHEEPDGVIRSRFVRFGDGVGDVTLEANFVLPDSRAATPGPGPGADFDGTPFSVSWADGETGIKEVEIPLFDDDFVDDPALFEVIFEGFVSLTPGVFYSDYYLPVPIIYDYEDRDLLTDTDGDGAVDLFDLDADNDLILNFEDPTPLGTDIVNPLDDVVVVEDSPSILVDLSELLGGAAPTATFAVADNSNPSLFEATSIVGDTLTLTPAAEASGIADITIEAQTPDGVSADTFTVQIDPVADVPQLILTDPPAALIGQPISLAPPVIETFLVDADGSEVLTVGIDGVPPEFVLSEGNELPPGSGSWLLEQAELATVSLQPIAPRVDPFALSVTAVATETISGEEAFVSGLLNISILNVNELPDALDDDVGAVQVGATLELGFADVLANDTGIANEPLTIAATDGALGTVTVNEVDRTITYSAGTDAAGEDVFSYTVTDVDGDADTANVSIFVNDTPVAGDDVIETVVETAIVVPIADLLENDSGLLNPPIDFTVEPPANGTLTVNDAEQTLTYTPNADFAGFDVTEYQITDSDGESATATLTLFSDAFPIADPDNGGTTVVNNPILGIDVLANDVLGNGSLAAGTVELSVELAPNATVTVDDSDPANPVLDYTPNPGFSGEDTFLYKITDEDKDISIGLVSVFVSSASGIPGPNVNIVGPTPNDPLYCPDTGFRQQNEVVCAIEAENTSRLMCVFNDWRCVELNGDGGMGVAMSRDGGVSWFSRLAPHHNQYEEIVGLAQAEDPDLGFMADPWIVSVPGGGMVTSFIASFRDPERKGEGGMYVQRWFPRNTEIRWPFEPQVQLLPVALGEPGPNRRFIDKDHLYFRLDESAAANDTVTVAGTLEDGTEVSQEWPQGDLFAIYTQFNGSDGELIEFEDFTPGPLIGQQGWVVSGDVDNVNVVPTPFLGTQSISLDSVALTEPTTAARVGILPEAAVRGTQIIADILLLTPGEAGGTTDFEVATPFGAFTLSGGEVIASNGDRAPFVSGDVQRVVLFADPDALVYNLQVGEASFFDLPITAPITSADIAITAQAAGEDELFVDVLAAQVATDSDVFVTRSSNYGESWTTPELLTSPTEGPAAHQGAYLAAIDDTVVAVWRRFNDPLNRDSAQTDAIMFTRSLDGGDTWSDAEVAALICPFDQFKADDRFRTRSFPALTTSGDEFVMVWADRGYAPGATGGVECTTGPSRIVLSRLGSTGGWSTPSVVDPITQPGKELAHQFMPAINAYGLEVQVSWYDNRDDESGAYTPQINDAADTIGEDVLLLRHTLDVRSIRVIDGVTAGDSVRVTQFQQGVTQADTTQLVQLERFYANPRMFERGRSPFLGDYMGVATREHRRRADGGWQSNKTAGSETLDPAFFWLSWADTRDVRGDVWEDLEEPTEYTPPMPELAAKNVVFERVKELLAGGADPTATPVVADASDGEAEADATAQRGDAEAASESTLLASSETAGSGAAADGLLDTPDTDGMCIPGSPSSEFQALSRNQNVYGSMIRPGLQVTAPTPSKSADGTQRAFVVYLQNFTSGVRDFEVEILNQPGDGRASFKQLPLDNSEPPEVLSEAKLQARSSVTRTVYITGGSDGNVPVDVEVREINCDPAECESQLITLNGSALTEEFSNEGLASSGEQEEVRTPEIGEPTINVSLPNEQLDGLPFAGFQFLSGENPLLQFPLLQFPLLQFPLLQFEGLENPLLQFPLLQFPLLQFNSLSDGAPVPVDFDETATVPEGGLRDPLENAELAGQVEGLRLIEAVYPVTNQGSVISAFELEPFVNADTEGLPSQLIVIRTYVNTTLIGCDIVPQYEQEVIVNLANPDLDGEDSGVSVYMAPGETLLVVVRIWQPEPPVGEPPPSPVETVEEEDFAFAAMATSCDSNTIGADGSPATCDPDSDDPDLMPPMATAGSHPVDAVFALLSRPGVDITQSRVRYDRRAGIYASTITVTNNSGETILGQLRAVLDSNRPPREFSGETEAGQPFFTLLPRNNSALGPGESVSVTVTFDRGRPVPAFNTLLELKSVAP